ncbi:MAG: ParB/RepB/Spo0J family partition protein [Desulfatibacillaceae bacterium]
MSTKKDKAKAPRRKALGMGLGALLPDVEEGAEQHHDYFMCDVDDIHANRWQPRVKFSEQELEELSLSIAEHGVIEPLVVRQNGGTYELIAGERRLRAAKIAGMRAVPVVVKDVDDDRMLLMTIVENIQRENLNPVEEAEGYHLLLSEFGLTQEQVAERVGKKRSTVANFLRLRALPEDIRERILDGDLSMGHARAILGLEDERKQLMAARAVLTRNLSVRETEALVKRLKEQSLEPEPPRPRTPEEIHLDHLCEDLSKKLGTKVHISKTGKRGKLTIEFYADDDLDRLVEALRGS